jgi:hypothetical protein
LAILQGQIVLVVVVVQVTVVIMELVTEPITLAVVEDLALMLVLAVLFM